LLFALDDGSVVAMDVDEYFSGPEDLRRRELVYGILREPPAPRFGHQTVVGRAFVLLDGHAREHRLGVVCVSPVDVVLDERKALVVQPDVLFVSNERLAIVRDQVWGAPDLAVEVTSRGTARFDTTTKLEWYRQYGVRECWLLDPAKRVVTVINFEITSADGRRSFTNSEAVRSAVLPEFAREAAEFFCLIPARSRCGAGVSR
jgi:Uma2 family endonuclease